MTFPLIKTIDDILPYVEHNHNFSVYTKSDYTVINYNIMTPDMFTTPQERECRGILFYSDGTVMARRYHKFFNYGERPESTDIDWSQPHVILEKLDGSMITPIWVHGELTWGSKAGETFLTPQVEGFVKKNPQYARYAEHCNYYGNTPIFEWCSRQNKLCIDYPEDRLVLTAIRNNLTGCYFPYKFMVEIANKYDVEVVKAYPDTPETLKMFAEQVRDMKGIEGFVVRFDDGTMVKIKTEEHLRQHNARAALENEKNIISILVHNEADDLKSMLPPNDKDRLERFEKDFWFYLKEKCKIYQYQMKIIKESGLTRKTFADTFPDTDDINKFMKRVVFKFWEKEEVTLDEILELLISMIEKKCGSQTGIDEVRHLFVVNWKDYQ